MYRNLKVLTALVGGLVVAAGGIAYAAPNLSGPAVSGGPAAAAPHITTTSAITQTEFVPIKPCRIVDTRKATGGALVPNAAREIIVAGSTGFAAQGGKSGGCGIPAGATALAASLSATGITGTGIIHAWPFGTSEPNATVVNYNKVAGSTTTGATLAVTPNVAAGLLIKAQGKRTQFVIDVTGYYREPIAGTVSSNGTLTTSSSQVVSAARSAGNPTGVYSITFDHNVDGCSLQVTPNTTGYVLVTGTLNGTTALIVGRAPGSGTLTDTPVAFTVTC